MKQANLVELLVQRKKKETGPCAQAGVDYMTGIYKSLDQIFSGEMKEKAGQMFGIWLKRKGWGRSEQNDSKSRLNDGR